MKYKLIAAILALNVMSWAQTTTETTPTAPQQSSVPDKAKCPCCDKMAAEKSAADKISEGAADKDAPSCCAHHDMKAAGGKDGASCCSGKDAKSCKRGGKDKMAKACCGDKCSKDKMESSCCGDKCMKDSKGCCSADKKSAKATQDCCAGQHHS